MALNTVSSERLSTNVKTSNLGSELKGKVGERKNLIINGAMQVAQRGTSASATGGYKTVDRYETATGGVNEAPTQAQADVTSGGAYDAGFRKCLKVTNGNQTSTDAGDNIIALRYKVEAQDMANSGWNYTSSSSNVTLSFWIKSSVAQSFKGFLRTRDGTEQRYTFDTGSLTQNTWTKVTKTIPGNSNLTFNNDNDKGLQIVLSGFYGTDYTDNSVTENAWAAYAASTRMKDNTSTWYTTNDATLEITGVQLEVGSTATDFEHRSFAQELALCQRYFHIIKTGSGEDRYLGQLQAYASGSCHGKYFHFPVTMRATPTTTLSGTITPTNSSGNFSSNFSSATFDRNTTDFVGSNNTSGSSGLTAGNAASVGLRENSSISSSAEL